MSKGNEKRIVSFAIEFKQKDVERLKYLWDAHIKPNKYYKVVSIGEGDAISELMERDENEMRQQFEDE